MNWQKKLFNPQKLNKRERIFIVPNGYGLMYFAGVLVTLLSGAIFTNNLSYILCFFILAILLAGMQQTNANLKGIQIIKFMFPIIEEGQTQEAIVWLKNTSDQDHFNLKLKSQQNNNNFEVIIKKLPSQTLTPIRFHFSGEKFGIQKVNKIQLSTHYPFGLFFAWRAYKIPSQFQIFPKKEGLRPLPEKFPLDFVGLFKKNGEDFSQHKVYVQGDSLKNIDWKIYARRNQLFTKEFNEGSNFVIPLKSNFNNDSNDKEKTLRQLSKWIDICEINNTPYFLEISSFPSPAGVGTSHKEFCLKKLSELGDKYD